MMKEKVLGTSEMNFLAMSEESENIILLLLRILKMKIDLKSSL